MASLTSTGNVVVSFSVVALTASALLVDSESPDADSGESERESSRLTLAIAPKPLAVTGCGMHTAIENMKMDARR